MKTGNALLTGLVCLAVLLSGVPESGAITTPKNSTVPDVCYPTEMTQALIDAYNVWATTNYPDATWKGNASATYNCHGYAWHVSEGGSNVWIGCITQTAEDIYWTDGSYCEVETEACAEKVSYADDNHSAITTGTSGTFRSKWGSAPLMEHTASYCPYTSTGLKYYKKNDDPGVDILGFTVVNGVASWVLESLYHTESLALEGRRTANDPWEPMPMQIPIRVGKTSVDVGTSGFNFFRLVETETTGKRLVQGEVRAQTVAASELERHSLRPEAAPSLESAKAQFKEARDQAFASGYRKVPLVSATTGKMVIYTNGTMVDAVTEAIASYWTSAGYQVVVGLVDGYPSDPDDFRATLDAAIVTQAGAGAGYFLLVGDASDWVEFSQPWPGGWEAIRQSRIASGYPAGGQPEKDIIPTWIIPDPAPRDQGMSYYNPYWFTDQPYADLNGDDIPDVVVSRLPFTTEVEVYGYATKLWCSGSSSWNADHVAFVVGNRIRSDSDGTRARLAAWNVMQSVPVTVTQDTLYWSQCYYDTDRNTLPATLINTYEPELLVEIASLSNRYYPGDFFDKTIGYIPWTMGLLTTTHPLVFLSASCGGADYARTESPTYALPIPHQFLAASNKGAVVWIGPTAGSWQNGNEAVASAIIEELYEDPGRPMGTSYTEAIRRVLIEHAEEPEVVQVARSYQFLGDPLVPFAYISPPPPPSGGGGCPYVYAYDGENFRMENTILGPVAPEAAGNQEANFADSYVLQNDLAPDNGVYRIEVREFEQEHVYVDRVQLLAVDHPEGTELLVTDDGRLVVHRGWLLPIEARTARGEDLLATLSARDDDAFEGKKGDEVVLKYKIPRNTDVAISMRPKDKTIDPPPDPSDNIQVGIEALLRKPGSDEYISLGSFLPREYFAPRTRIIADRLSAEGIRDGEFEIRLLWHSDHGLDFAGLLVPLQIDPPTMAMELQEASHSKDWDVQESLSHVDGRFVELVPGETVSLSFAATELAGEKRSFVLVADGHYVGISDTDDRPYTPTFFRLYPNRPNPFNPTTTIAFDLPEQARVTISVYSVDGRLVRTLTDRVFPAGRHNVGWDGRDGGGREVSSGVYFYTLRTPLQNETRKMTLLK